MGTGLVMLGMTTAGDDGVESGAAGVVDAAGVALGASEKPIELMRPGR